MPSDADLVVVPRDGAEALIDLRARYGRCVRMAWTLVGVAMVLAITLAVTVWHHSIAMRNIDRLTEKLEQVTNGHP